MKPNILAILPGLVPSTIINVTTPLVDLHKAQLVNTRVTLELFVKEKDIEWSDLIIFCRNVEAVGARWLSKVLEKNKPFIYDIDDNFFELSAGTSVGKYHTSPERLTMLEQYIRRANLVRVYSEAMLERSRSLNPQTQKVNGYIDWRLVTIPPRGMDKQPVKIVYATSRVDDNLAEIFKPALKKILEKYGEQIEVFFLGYNPPEFKHYPNAFFKPLNLNYEKYLRNFSISGFDIGLAPLFDDVFHRSKTNLKVREFGACHIAGIYSDVDTYSASITHNKNGLLVKSTPEAWYKAMSVLIENHALRRQIQEQAYLFAQENFSQEAFTQVWYSQISEILNRSPEERDLDRNLQYQILDHKERRATRESTSATKADRKLWLCKMFFRFASGIKSKGLSFLLSYIRMKSQMLWILLKIKFTLH
jgi:glycosyltransferase involved in cell wall biosynthesis